MYRVSTEKTTTTRNTEEEVYSTERFSSAAAAGKEIKSALAAEAARVLIKSTGVTAPQC